MNRTRTRRWLYERGQQSQPHHRYLTAAVVLVVAMTAAGCTTGSASPTNTGKTTVADPKTVLDQLATELRSQVDGLASGLNTTFTGVNSNGAKVCGTPMYAEWPQQWGYGRRLILTEPDSRPAVHKIADTLHAQGWTLRTDRDLPDDLQIVAQREGAIIYLAGGNTDGIMLINGASACVNADGTVDRRPVA